MSDEPMKGFSTPGDQVKGPQDLVARMNTATSENWETIPFPARQQLGWHDRLGVMTINDYTGKGPEDLVHSPELSAPTDDTAKLSSFVDYHLEVTPPPAEPAGAPGSDGYNRLNRQVPPAKGFENPADATVSQTHGARAVQFAPDQGLSAEEQAKVDGVGPHVPSPVTQFAGAGDGNLEERDLPKYGTANGAPHGRSQDYDPAGNRAEQPNEQTGAVAPEAASNVAAASTGTGSGGGAVQAAQPAAAPPQVQPASSGESDIPEGSIDKVLAWVGEDKGRAQQALDAEQAKPEPRRSLIAHLNDKIK